MLPCLERAGLFFGIFRLEKVAVAVPNMAKVTGLIVYRTALGFGVCRETSDPKIVKITYIESRSQMESITHIPWQVEVFTLSTRAWRSPCSGNLPRKSVQFCWEQVVVDGLLYWLAIDGIAMDGGFRHYNLIISFDMTSEEFREVNLPDSLACVFGYKLSMSKLRESLAVLKHCEWATSVWMMQDGVPKSFTKLFTFNAPHASLRGFGKSGEPIIQTVELNRGFPYCPYSCSFAVYEPDTKQINNLWIMGFVNLFSVYPYMETLLLLDQPDSIIYDKGKGNNSKSRAKNKRILKHTRKSQNSSSQKQLICSFVG